MEENKLSKLYKLDFYKKKSSWAYKNTSSKPVSCKDKRTDGAIHKTNPKKRMENKDYSVRFQDTALMSLTSEESAGPSNVVYDETRLISSRLNLLMKLSNIEREKTEQSAAIVSNDHSESKMNIKESMPGKLLESLETTDPEEQDSDLNMSSVKLYSQEDVLECKYENKLYKDLKVDPSMLHEHKLIDDQIVENCTRMYKDMSIVNDSSTSYEPESSESVESLERTTSINLSIYSNNPNPNNNKKEFVSFMRGIHNVPHSSLNDIKAYTQYTVLRSEHMTEYKILKMSPKQLAANLYKVSDIWTKVLTEVIERSYHINNMGSNNKENRCVSFLNKEQLIPHALMKDINFYNNMMLMGETDELTRYKLAEMTPNQLMINIFQLSRMWRQMINVSVTRTFGENKTLGNINASAGERSKHATRRCRSFSC